MSAPSRRIFFYWLLLLVPTLAVGAGSMYLLVKEQGRLQEQAGAAAALRRETISARARLIAENVELLMGDVQNGLMASLNEAPASNPGEFLDTWAANNPLVRATFQVAADGSIVRSTAGDTQRWLERWLAEGPPWRGVKQEWKESDFATRQRKDTAANVMQNQSLRSSLQETARQNSYFDSLKNTSPLPGRVAVEHTAWTPWRGADGLHLIGWRQTVSGAVLGVEVNLATIGRRLHELLPRDGDMADAFEIREDGVAWQRKIYDPSFSRARIRRDEITVPLAVSVLPGWEIAGFVSGDAMSAGFGFLLVGTLLIGSFVLAILAAGALLLRQARRSEAEAAQKTSFVANVSHEFKTPLTTIRLYAELLEQGRVRDAAQGGDYLRTIGRETQRLARLVNNALDFSRLEQGRKKFAREALDLGAVLTRLLDTLGPRLAETGLVLHRELPAAPVTVQTDRDALEQIVINLLDNAAKYAVDAGELTLAVAACARGGAELRVLDRGPGVPPEHRARIFEKFHRVDDALTAEKGGAGLGLSIARQLARGLGGELRYAPRAGGGAEFILTLP